MSAPYLVTGGQRLAEEHRTLLAAMAAATRLVHDGVRDVRVTDQRRGIFWIPGVTRRTTA